MYSDIILHHSNWTQKLKALNIKVRSTVFIVMLIFKLYKELLLNR